MKFFKENSYDIVKLLINQLGIAIFAFMLYVTASLIENSSVNQPLRVCISVFSILFYYALIYSATGDIGAKDRIKIDGGKYKPTPFKGGLMATFANLPNFLVVGIAIICKMIHYFGGAEGFNLVFGILNALFRFFMSMYLGAIGGIFSFVTDENLGFLLESVGYFLFPIIAIAVCQLGYYLGTREWRFSNLLSSDKSKP